MFCSFVLQNGGFWGGPDETRTRDLRHPSATRPVLACPATSENYAILQVFYEVRFSSSSIPYASVPARLQYGCSNFPVLTSMSRRYVFERSIFDRRTDLDV